MNTGHLSRQQGFSLIELMVGIVVALIVVSGTMKMFADYLVSNQRLVSDTQLQQDLRVAGDIIARDLRRAGYWRNAIEGTTSPVRASPQGSIKLSGTASAAQVDYRYTGNEGDHPKEDDDDSNDVGFRLNAETIKIREGNSGWQDITDPNKVRVSRLSIVPIIREVSLGHLCVPTCTIADADCPRLRIRSYDITITARSATRPALTRETRSSVRVRNDEVSPATCR